MRNRVKALLRGILSGGVWNGFLLGKVQGENVPCRFCGGPDGEGHLFGSVPIPLLLILETVLNFMTLSIWIRLAGLGAFFGMVDYQLCLVLILVVLGQLGR